ncbi:MAG: GtrA family protein [Lachnospiraceae bacterium]|jgi:putative flippase GtrA|nr:GtrA family protein [Lachnospiraceae bacterium]
MKKQIALIKQIIKFGIVGVISTMLDYGLMIFFKEICSLHYLLASTLSYTISLLFNYVASMKYVFQSKEDTSKWKEFFIFTILCLLGMGINQLVLWLIVEHASLDYRISKIFATMVVMVWNFVTRKLFLEKK